MSPIFPNSAIGKIARYTDAGPGPKGSAMTVAFQLDGQQFTALNGGPIFKFTEAISFVVHCETQQEVDEFWERLSQGGQPGQCGWLKDKFGLSWQIVPIALMEMVQDKNPARVERVMKAMMQMKKLDIAGLEKAYRQE
jgi:predicted 3-demethylubiquinone-9 3-methyltransferase (glyoxalase superfamily)